MRSLGKGSVKASMIKMTCAWGWFKLRSSLLFSNNILREWDLELRSLWSVERSTGPSHGYFYVLLNGQSPLVQLETKQNTNARIQGKNTLKHIHNKTVTLYISWGFSTEPLCHQIKTNINTTQTKYIRWTKSSLRVEAACYLSGAKTFPYSILMEFYLSISW